MLRHKHRTEDEHVEERDVDARTRDDGYRDRDAKRDEPTVIARDPAVAGNPAYADRSDSRAYADRTDTDDRTDTFVDDDRHVDDRDVRREPAPVVTETTERDDQFPPPPHESGVRVEQVTTETVFSPGQVIIMLAGAAALALGIATLVDAGLGGSITEPVVEVFNFDHTPLLGVIETVAGVLLLLCGLRPGGRTLAGLIGALMVAGGVVILADIDWVQENLGAEQRFGWVPIIIGGAALLGAFALPRTSRRRVTVVR